LKAVWEYKQANAGRKNVSCPYDQFLSLEQQRRMSELLEQIRSAHTTQPYAQDEARQHGNDQSTQVRREKPQVQRSLNQL
jgi:hypothetical protein